MPDRRAGERFRSHWDAWLLGITLLMFNLPLFFGYDTSRWAYYPALFGQGKWWLALTGQLAHVSWYHFLLDGAPFGLIYLTLEQKNPFRRLLYVFGAGVGSLIAATLFSTDVAQHGLRGLSGITYGIMAVSALEMVFETADRPRKFIGLSVLFLLLGLIVYELLTGKFPFDFLLFNMVGKPILVCHAGGVIGAIIGFFILRRPRSQAPEKIN